MIRNLRSNSSSNRKKGNGANSEAGCSAAGQSPVPPPPVEQSRGRIKNRSKSRTGESASAAGQGGGDEENSLYTSLRVSEAVADWDDVLKDLDSVARICPVDYFKHAPLSSVWSEFAQVGRKIELPHPQSVGDTPVYCLASIVAFAGYKALVKFDKMGPGTRYTAWISYCSSMLKPVGFSIHNEYLILPVAGPDLAASNVKDIASEYIGHLSRMKGYNLSNTISNEHKQKIHEELEKCRTSRNITVNQIFEVLDKENRIQNRLAIVCGVIGDRVHFRYLDALENDPGYIFNIKSDFIHPLGWSHRVGQQLKRFDRTEINFPIPSKQHFPYCPSKPEIMTGMQFELVHPIFLNKIVSGFVKKKLKFGYFVARIEVDNNPELNGDFVYHITSDYILPCGFSLQHNISLEVPARNWQLSDDFSWERYFKDYNLVPLDLSQLPPKINHKFSKGCKMEAVDLRQPFFFGPVTVLDVAGHLLYVHFDGYPREDNYFQWISAFSPDIYPAGWAEMVGHSYTSHPELVKSEDNYSIVK